MSVKKPTFLENVWSAVKKPVQGIAKIAGTGIGTLIGVPALGTLASNLLGGIPTVKEMAAKVAASGTVDQTKVAATLEKNNIPATPENVHAASEGLKKIVASDPDLPQTSPSELKTVPGADNVKVPFLTKAKLYVKQHTIIVVGGIVVIGGIIYLLTKKRR